MRVFKDVILSNLIEPKFKKKDLDEMDYQSLKTYAEYVINTSLKNWNILCEDDFEINKKIFLYENKIFNLTSYMNVLLDNKISFKSAINLLDADIPKNLQWLKKLETQNDIINERTLHSLHFPIEKLILTEGITEEILLPEFAKKCGLDFDKNGIHIISAGGKNQVVKLFYSLTQLSKLPIFVLLDNDAESNLLQIKPRLRKIDKIHLLNCGEFEDILPHDLIQKTLNSYFQNFTSVDSSELDTALPMVKILENIFKQKGFHLFKKSEFAHLIKNNMSSFNDISDEIKEVVNEISSLAFVF